MRSIAGSRLSVTWPCGESGGTWATLGQDLKPEYRVVSGIRRFSSQQGGPLQGLGQLTPERAEKEKWYAYRDAPLYIAPPAAPGAPWWVEAAVVVRGRRPRAAAPRAVGGRCCWTWRRACGAGVRVHLAKARRHSPRELVVQDDDLRRQDRRSAHRGHVQRSLDGDLHWKSAVHSVSRNQPHSHGRSGVDQRTVCGLQVRCGPDWLLDGPALQACVERCRGALRSSISSAA